MKFSTIHGESVDLLTSSSVVLFKVQWVVQRLLCPPAPPAWRKASQAAVSTASQPRRSPRGLERSPPRRPRHLPEEWRKRVWIP